MFTYNFTIIVPHYNLPHLLHRCLASIPQREDVQVIVVDDCSHNFNIEEIILSHHTSRYKLEVYVMSQNGGAGIARNYGLQKAKGKWILFADSDDYFNYCMNDLMNEYADAPQDVVYFNANSMESDTCYNAIRTGYVNEFIESYLTAPEENAWMLRYNWGEPWGKMIKQELIDRNGIQFDTYRIHEDCKFAYLTGYYATTICADRRAAYCATYREGSLSRIYTDELYSVLIRVFMEKYTFLTSHGVTAYPLITSLIYEVLSHYHYAGDVRHFNKTVDLIESYGIERTEVLKEWKRTFAKVRWHNRKVFVKQKLCIMFDKLLPTFQIFKY